MLKHTKVREQILEIFDKFNYPLSAYDISENLSNKDINLSTIYRTLKTFSDNKIISKDIDENGIAKYTLVDNSHQHFLECKSCHKKIELDYCPYHKVNEQIKSSSDFFVDEHNTTIYGTCKDCKFKK